MTTLALTMTASTLHHSCASTLWCTAMMMPMHGCNDTHLMVDILL